MKLFSCSNCDQVLFFENTRCMSCGQGVGYCVETRELVAITGEEADPGAFDVLMLSGKLAQYRKCQNYIDHDACNWLVQVSDNQPYCHSCRLNQVIPNLSDASNRSAWVEIERAKRRLLYTLYALKLPVISREEDASGGLAFRFLRSTEEEQVMTGHNEGTITLNVAEAEASYRENMREKLGEGYRTVLGHMRHESGHYYWDRLVRGGPALEGFRALFGDEQASYDEAVKRHYDQGPPANWPESFISAYATMHPWEDWAETWAHYLHMIDTLETAKHHGLTVRIPGKLGNGSDTEVATDTLAFRNYASLSTAWQAVTVALNNLNRSMGMKDIYPFVLSPPVHEKLRFVHELIQRPRAATKPVEANEPAEPAKAVESKPPESARRAVARPR